MALKNYVAELGNSTAFNKIDALSKSETNLLCKIATLVSKIDYTKGDSHRKLKMFTMTFNANGNEVFRKYSDRVIELLA